MKKYTVNMVLNKAKKKDKHGKYSFYYPITEEFVSIPQNAITMQLDDLEILSKFDYTEVVITGIFENEIIEQAEEIKDEE